MAETGDTPGRRLERIQERVAAAAARAGRPSGGVRLVAVGKTFPAESLRQLAGAGQRAFGENRVQEAEGKAAALADLALEWHLVGHLQSNKAGKAATIFHWVHSLDSERTGRRLARAAVAAGRRVRALVQVDLAGETAKSGVPEPGLRRLLESLGVLAGLELRGLMVLPPLGSDAESSRPWFRRLRLLAGELSADGLLPAAPDLSMGMSGDYEVAVEEGATLVRVGTALFGRRAPVSG